MPASILGLAALHADLGYLRWRSVQGGADSGDQIGKESAGFACFMSTRSRTGWLRRRGELFGVKIWLEFRVCKSPRLGAGLNQDSV